MRNPWSQSWRKRDNALDDDRCVVGDRVADDASQAEIARQKQRRRSSVVGPASAEPTERRHVSADVLVTQAQIIAGQPQLALLHGRRQLCIHRLSCDHCAINIEFAILAEWIKTVSTLSIFSLSPAFFVRRPSRKPASSATGSSVDELSGASDVYRAKVSSATASWPSRRR